MEYSVLLDILTRVERSLHAKCELFNEIIEVSKYNKSLRDRFNETLRKAESDLKQSKLG